LGIPLENKTRLGQSTTGAVATVGNPGPCDTGEERKSRVPTDWQRSPTATSRPDGVFARADRGEPR
jgi:hypothetical protein